MPIRFEGLIVPFLRRHLLVFGPEAAAFGLAEPVFGPPVFVRPGYHLYARDTYVLPTAAIDDIGQRFEPPQAYAWIEERGDLFPRSDLIGELTTGEPQRLFMKEADLTDLAVFAAPRDDGRAVRVDLVVEAPNEAGQWALAPSPCPAELALFERALPCYRLSPSVFGSAGAAILTQLLATGRRDWRLSFDDLDDALD